jgi:hypothetical protein
MLYDYQIFQKNYLMAQPHQKLPCKSHYLSEEDFNFFSWKDQEFSIF